MPYETHSFRLRPHDLALLKEGQRLLNFESKTEVVRYCLNDTVRQLRARKVVVPHIIAAVHSDVVRLVRQAVADQCNRKKRSRKKRA